MKIFAGPNGSGKTTLFEVLSQNDDTEIFLNADPLSGIKTSEHGSEVNLISHKTWIKKPY